MPLPPAAGGTPGLTVGLQNQYRKYNMDQQVNGYRPLPWKEWLESNGYTLDEQGLVIPAPPEIQDALYRDSRY